MEGATTDMKDFWGHLSHDYRVWPGGRPKERQKAAALEKARLKEERAKKALAKTPEQVMKEADREEG